MISKSYFDAYIFYIILLLHFLSTLIFPSIYSLKYSNRYPIIFDGNTELTTHGRVTKDIYSPGFDYSNERLCSPHSGKRVKLLILVLSAPNNFRFRDAIRFTWGTYGKLRFDIKMAFVLGRTEDKEVQQEINNEKYLYNDVIIGKFEDTYDNLTLKTMSCLEWTGLYCKNADFVLKTDDDMFINIPNLLSLIERIENQSYPKAAFYGRVVTGSKPDRLNSFKYYVSFDEYENTYFPNYTTGPAYLFSGSIVPMLFEFGKNRMEMRYMKLEDVHITGSVAEQLGIKHFNIPEMCNRRIRLNTISNCVLGRLISIHSVSFEGQFEIWKRTSTGNQTKCRKPVSEEAWRNLILETTF